MLARDEVFRDLHLLKNLIAELKLLDLAKLGKVAAKDQKVRGRIHSLDVFGRSHRFFDETRVEGLGIEMSVRNPGELKWRFCGVSNIDGVDQRPPREGLADGGGPEQQRSVHERTAGDLYRVVGAHSRLLQHRVYLAPSAFKFVRHVVPPDRGTVYKALVLMEADAVRSAASVIFCVFYFYFFSSISNLEA